LERELHNEVLLDVTVGGTLGSGGQWPVKTHVDMGKAYFFLWKHLKGRHQLGDGGTDRGMIFK
jgi:hypothetical protein